MCKFVALNSKRHMTIEYFKREIDEMFPCKWTDDFLQDIHKTFEQYYCCPVKKCRQ